MSARRKPVNGPGLSIIETMEDPVLFAPWFDGPTWANWKAILKAAFALPMSDDEVAFFRTVAERDPPTEPVRELWVIGGRRSGKDSIASLIAAHVASMFRNTGQLRRGERGVVMCLGCDREQARIVLNFTRSYFTEIPALAARVKRETAMGFELINDVDIAVSTNNFRAVRGRPILCVILDECAFYLDESSSTPDEEVYQAVRPGMASLAPASMLIGISSPYRKSGLLHRKYRNHFGKAGAVLVIKAPTRALNPTISQAIVDQALQDDPAAARAEWLAEFRDDIAAFIDREAVEACVANGVREIAPAVGVKYSAFVDPSGGSVDAMTLAIAHRDGQRVVIDATRERTPPFSPEEVVDGFAATLRTYGITAVHGDRYAGEWPRERFRKCGITYKPSEAPKSDLFRDLLPMLNAASIVLLDNPRLIAQIAGLERRTSRGGRDSIDHQPGAHDDLANAVAGAAWLHAVGKPFEASRPIVQWQNGHTFDYNCPSNDPRHERWAIPSGGQSAWERWHAEREWKISN